MTSLHPEQIRRLGQSVLQIERDAIDHLINRIDDAFVRACELCIACTARIVVVGMGKSGHIGNKIAATLASTGTPAFFVHPGEASHGDLGMITRADVVLALSNSGETAEITAILPVIKRLGVPLIAMTGRADSTLARMADVHLDVGVNKEACPLNLAPTASTTATLAMGDALAVALLEARGFTEADFALSHPGGSLGRRLLLKIDDLLHSGDDIPRVAETVTVAEALVEMTQKGLGMTVIDDTEGRIVGIYTDGDLRRTLDGGLDVHNTPLASVLANNPKVTAPRTLPADALQTLHAFSITTLGPLDDTQPATWHPPMHALLVAGFV